MEQYVRIAFVMQKAKPIGRPLPRNDEVVEEDVKATNGSESQKINGAVKCSTWQVVNACFIQHVNGFCIKIYIIMFAYMVSVT